MRILCELYPDTMIMLMKEGIQNGITLEILMTKKHKKTPEEKAAVAKQKKQQMRAKLKKETRDNLAKEEILQDDRFFFIAGYTSGGAPYGITLEEMGLKPWDFFQQKQPELLRGLMPQCRLHRFR